MSLMLIKGARLTVLGKTKVAPFLLDVAVDLQADFRFPSKDIDPNTKTSSGITAAISNSMHSRSFLDKQFA